MVELDEYEKKEFWYKIKIKEMEELLLEVHFYTEYSTDMKKVAEAVNPEYYMDEQNKKSRLDARCDELLLHYLENLKGWHVGDCTCIPCSCSKCHAEDILGINTIKGLGKHAAHKVNAAFGEDNERTIDEAIERLGNYEPVLKKEYEQFQPRWSEEAKNAYDWLVLYKNTYLI